MNIRSFQVNVRNHWLAILLICITAGAIYSNTFHSPFMFDDQHTVQENSKIRSLSNFYRLGILQSPRPLTDYTFALNYHFGKLHVPGYHIVNLCIHVINGILMLFLSRMIFRRLFPEDTAGSDIMALCAALIFVAHPLQTEAVTYIAQRYAAMESLFYLSAIMAYMKGRELETGAGNFVRYGWFVTCFIAGVLSFLCKQNAASLPLSILLIEYVVYDRSWRGWRKKLLWIVPGTALLALACAYNMGLFRHSIQLGSLLEDVSGMSRETKAVGRWQYLCTQFNVIPIYIRLLLFPVHQNLDYRYPMKSGFFDGATPYFFVFLAALVAGSLAARKKHPVILLGVFWFFITLSVESSIFPIRDALFEHRLYLPMAGFAWIVSYAGIQLLPAGVQRVVGFFHYRDKRLLHTVSADAEGVYARWWSYGILVVAIIGLGAATYHRNEVWQDPVTLWSDVASKSPDNYRGITNLAFALEQRGDYKAALAYYNRALQLNPDYYFALNNKGALLGRQGKTKDAIALFKLALHFKPDYPSALNNLGVAYGSERNIDIAVGYFKKALALQPDYLDAMLNLANASMEIGKYPEAIQQYEAALKLYPESANIHVREGNAFHYQGKYQDAITQYDAALKLDTGNADAYLNRGNSLSALGRYPDAVASYKEAVRLNPKSVEAYTNMGAAFIKMGKKDEAAEQFRAALDINPSMPEVQANMGALLASQGKFAEALKHYGAALKLKPDSEPIREALIKLMQGNVGASHSNALESSAPAIATQK